MRQIRRHRLLQHPLTRAAALLVLGRHTRGELDQIQIEKGHARLHTRRHRHFVRIDQVVIGQKEALLQQQHPLQPGKPHRCGFQEIDERLRRPSLSQLRLDLGRVQGEQIGLTRPQKVVGNARVAVETRTIK